MADMRERRLHALHGGIEHVDVHAVALRRAAVLVVIVLLVGPAIEVGRSLVLVRAAVLSRCRVSGMSEGREIEITHVGPPRYELPQVARGVLVQLLVAAKDDHRDVDRAEHR